MTETFFYLTTTGRSTGRPHKIEIWFVEHDGCYYLCAGGRTNADWVQNIQQQPHVSYYLAQSKDAAPDATHTGIATPLDDETDPTVQQVKRLFDAKYNWSRGLLLQICPTPTQDAP